MTTVLKLTSASFVVAALSVLISGCSQGGGTASANSGSHGRELYQLHCLDCHEGNNLNLRKQPPKLNGLFHAKTLPSGAPLTDVEIRKTIIEGRGIMPAFDQRLSDKEIEELIKYLHTM
jgi:mono/diheme cytochrome c family protein